MMGALTDVEEGDEIPWTAHVEPLIHVEIDAEGPLEAQMKAQKKVVEALGETDLTAVEVNLESMKVDHHSLLGDMMGADDEVTGIDDMVPDDDSELDLDFGDTSDDDE